MLIRSDAAATAATASSSPSPPPSATTATTTIAQTSCGNCGLEELRLLHHVRHRGTFRRLCTTCVLRLHPQSFCPGCFVVYNSTPNPAVTCSKCYSSSHTECVGNHPNPYVCPLCVSPNSPIFAPKKVKDLISENPEAANGLKDVGSGEYRVIDKKNAKILLAAAKISAVSMSKAAVAARAEAERRAKEAAFTRKRARAALEHVAYLVAKEKLKKKERSGSGTGGGTMVRNSGNMSNGYAGSLNPAAMRVGGMMKRESGVGVGNGVRRGDGSNDVLAALNAVELREGEKKTVAQPGQPLLDNGVVPMDVELNGRVEITAGRNDCHGGAATAGGNGTRGNNHPHHHVVEQNNNVSGH